MSVKLYYFDLMGRGEMIRLLFAAAGKPLEDVRFSFEEWPQYKEKAPFGASPWVEVDGEEFAQSIPIATYFAKQFGFYATTDKDALLIDQMLNLIQDFIVLTVSIYEEENEETKAQRMKDCKEKDYARFFGYMEKLLAKNGTGFVAGSQLTLGDIAIYDAVTGWLKGFLGPLNDFPLINALVDKVGANEKIKAYVAARPITEA